jgi:hypothetical protein|tara:strand:+ start:5807 stop:6244 length:438 start_codon:yes stop_codon:yes gene_type:complete
MAYSGLYKPINPKKYKGNPTRIIYRSLWERKFMVFCDHTSSIIEWGSEEVIIPYRSPIDGRIHRYYPDFYIKVLTKEGRLARSIVEIKPKKQVKGPDPKPKRKTVAWKKSVMTFMKNKAKWDAAEDWCDDRRMKFMILTEDQLNV